MSTESIPKSALLKFKLQFCNKAGDFSHLTENSIYLPCRQQQPNSVYCCSKKQKLDASPCEGKKKQEIKCLLVCYSLYLLHVEPDDADQILPENPGKTLGEMYSRVVLASTVEVATSGNSKLLSPQKYRERKL